MINDKLTTDGESCEFNFTLKDTHANEVMMEVFNAVTELAQSGASEVRIVVKRVV